MIQSELFIFSGRLSEEKSAFSSIDTEHAERQSRLRR